MEMKHNTSMKFVTVLLSLALSLILILQHTSSGLTNQKDVRLDTLFVRLYEAQNWAEARPIEGRIWSIWLESEDEKLDTIMRQGILAMNARNYSGALDAFNVVIKTAPDFAEGWNKRATLYWLMGELQKSVDDIERTLALEPRHFGALSGLGMIRKEQRRPADAIQAYERVLAIYPANPSAADQIKILEDQLGKSI